MSVFWGFVSSFHPTKVRAYVFGPNLQYLRELELESKDLLTGRLE